MNFKTLVNEKFFIPVRFRLQWLYLQCFKGKEQANYKYGIGYVLYARNEGLYVGEWIEYHKLVSGCPVHFYIYDNRSNDNMKDVLRPYVERGEVTYKYVDAENQPQRQVYTDAVFHHRRDCKYMAFIDTDEFVYSVDGSSILNVLDSLFDKYSDRNMGGIFLNWLTFGSAGHEKRPEGLIIENYLYHSEPSYKGNATGKVIANPRKLKRMHIHNHEYYAPDLTLNEQGDPVAWQMPQNQDCHYTYLRLHHYASKSKEEALQRAQAGYGRRAATQTRRSHDLNDVYDDGMLKYVDALRKAVGLPPRP